MKIHAKQAQYDAMNEAIRTAQFIRNKALRFWMDNRGVGKYQLSAYCKVLAAEFPFANKLNSMARQSSADRAWAAISRFYTNCKKRRDPQLPKEAKSLRDAGATRRSPKGARESSTRHQVKGKKGFPKFKKHSRSVEYKTSGWKLSENRKQITFTDKNNIGRVKLKGTRDLNWYDIKQFKRVRIVRRADGYYCQFLVDTDNREKVEPSYCEIGLDVGLNHFYTDDKGNQVENPRFYRQGEKALNRLNRSKSRKYNKGAKPQSNNYHKARKRYAIKHLKISRQRKDHAVKLARCVVTSNDVVAYEDLRIAKQPHSRQATLVASSSNSSCVKNHNLAKSITDAGWYQFRVWLEYFGYKFGKITVAVPPQYTSISCSSCGAKVKKALSTRTHQCKCGCVLDRDENAARNILSLGLNTAGRAVSAWGDRASI